MTRRLIDLPGIDALELKAIMKRDFAEPEARSEYPEIDETSRARFGLTADEAEAVARPAGWDGVEKLPDAEQADAFEAEGWDVRDNKRRVLRTFRHFNQQLWLAARGVAGELPFAPDDDKPGAWGSNLAAEATKFRKR